ncbi:MULTISPECIES: TetR/AcrR family transcriptional regulator [unclassified Inquilinus]|uniref:TetR/AcrR family transcriptional regulator n=1 Tax=unclassified Inquilinus TaxID=2645927 RepID=UPI003F91CA95
MGHSRDDKAASHDRIVRIAAARFRESGVDGLGVAELMQEAGLTHGGFYRHFASRDDLVAEAVEMALGHSRVQTTTTRPDGAPRDYAEFVATYLDPAHRDDPANGCAVAALAGEAGRLDERPRAAFTRQFKSNLDSVAAMQRAKDPDASRAYALLAASALVGAVALSRAVSDPALSDEILAAVRARLVALAEGQP